MNIPKRNHSNPCFWIALWNEEYFNHYKNGNNSHLNSRDQLVWVLNIRSNSIYQTKVSNVHYDKELNLAEITYEGAKAFVKRHHPKDLEQFCKTNSEEDYPVTLDFEDLLTRIEKLEPYQILMDVNKKQRISSLDEKGFLANFILLQAIRSHAFMHAMIEMNSALGHEKFEYFIELKWSLSSKSFLLESIARLALSQWVIYCAREHTFPITDSPILINHSSIMVPLSPQMLLEIFLKIPMRENELPIKKKITTPKLKEYRDRAIGNSFKEIVFSQKSILERWQKLSKFSERVQLVNNMHGYNSVTPGGYDGDIWSINYLGNR